MKNIFTILMVVIPTLLFSQSINLSDYYDNTYIQYVKKNDSGTIIESGGILNNKYEGVVKTYNDNGVLTMVGNFYNGNRDGVWSFYDNNGFLIYQIKYKDNKKVWARQIKYYASND